MSAEGHPAAGPDTVEQTRDGPRSTLFNGRYRPGLDISAAGTFVPAAVDTFDPANPATPRGNQLRPGGLPGAGDVSVGIGGALVFPGRYVVRAGACTSDTNQALGDLSR